jgi:YVTN family beta-propeller protein
MNRPDLYIAAFYSATLAFLTVTAGCASQKQDSEAKAASAQAQAQTQNQPAPGVANMLPGMPPVTDPADIYAADHAGNLSPAVRDFPSRVYVPNSGSNTVDIIDPATYKIIGHFPVGRQPQHVVPSWDLKRLWVLNDLGDSLTAIDPMTGKKGETVPVEDPYNMYYTPDGKFAIVVAEAKERLDFRDPRTMKLVESLKVPCKGVDHMDFTADGRFLIASCEFDAKLIKVDVASRKLVGTLSLEKGGMPQDVKTSPDGKVFYIADMMANGIYLIEPDSFSRIGFMPTGKGTHGLYVSRDSKVLYISNRGEGSISILDLATRKLVAKWEIPHGGSPDMGGVSADGKVLWLSGRYNAEVYAFDTSDGHLLARIKVGKGPHGLDVFPQPGRYSLGHTGVYR